MWQKAVGWISSVFRRLTGVKTGEQVSTLLSLIFITGLMFAYNIMKPVRDAMAPEWSDVELAWLWTMTFAFSAIAVSVYGWVVSRARLNRVIPGVYAFFAASFLLFYVGARAVPDATIVDKAFYFWISLFSLFHISVFWSLMAEFFSKQQAVRLFGFIASGASIGALAGNEFTARFVETLGKENLILIAAVILLALLPVLGGIRFSVRNSYQGDSDAQEIRGFSLEGFRSLARNPYMLSIAFFIFLYTFIGSFAYFEIKNLMSVNDQDTNTVIWSRINETITMITIVTTMLATGRIAKTIGVGKSLALTPVLVAVAFLVIFVNPILSVVIGAWIVLKAGNYSVTKPARDMLYTIVSREDRFKTKQVIDIVVYRGGDALSSWIFTFLTAVVGLGLAGVAVVGSVVAVIWAFFGLRLGRKYDEAVTTESEVAQ